MRKVKMGVIGSCGSSMIQYCKTADNAELVAICDNNPIVLEKQRKALAEYNIAFYDNYDEFLKYDMDAVVLADYAHEHAPFAIKAMKRGKRVFLMYCRTDHEGSKGYADFSFLR